MEGERKKGWRERGRKREREEERKGGREGGNKITLHCMSDILYLLPVEDLLR